MLLDLSSLCSMWRSLSTLPVPLPTFVAAAHARGLVFASRIRSYTSRAAAGSCAISLFA
ncbi:hypothetical protein B0H10DRAFT_2211121 [Mycena sp. CBHHK59/15]|nr:hypothetical protein B0H10DRAFT_2211121 [Mycena sp. CBHHK59/15]